MFSRVLVIKPEDSPALYQVELDRCALHTQMIIDHVVMACYGCNLGPRSVLEEVAKSSWVCRLSSQSKFDVQSIDGPKDPNA